MAPERGTKETFGLGHFGWFHFVLVLSSSPNQPPLCNKHLRMNPIHSVFSLLCTRCAALSAFAVVLLKAGRTAVSSYLFLLMSETFSSHRSWDKDPGDFLRASDASIIFCLSSMDTKKRWTKRKKTNSLAVRMPDPSFIPVNKSYRLFITFCFFFVFFIIIIILWLIDEPLSSFLPHSVCKYLCLCSSFCGLQGKRHILYLWGSIERKKKSNA